LVGGDFIIPVTQLKEEEKIAWLGLREIYRLLGIPEGNTLVKMLIKNEEMRTNELIEKSEVPPSKFHPIMKALVLCQVVDRKVHPDRSVSYKVSPFGKNVLALSEPLLERIKEEFKDKDSALLSIAQKT